LRQEQRRHVLDYGYAEFRTEAEHTGYAHLTFGFKKKFSLIRRVREKLRRFLNIGLERTGDIGAVEVARLPRGCPPQHLDPAPSIAASNTFIATDNTIATSASLATFAAPRSMRLKTRVRKAKITTLTPYQIPVDSTHQALISAILEQSGTFVPLLAYTANAVLV
jgi:hypothetical protein